MPSYRADDTSDKVIFPVLSFEWDLFFLFLFSSVARQVS